MPLVVERFDYSSSTWINKTTIAPGEFGSFTDNRTRERNVYSLYCAPNNQSSGALRVDIGFFELITELRAGQIYILHIKPDPNSIDEKVRLRHI